MVAARMMHALLLLLCWGSAPAMAANCTAASLKPFHGDWKAAGWWRADAGGEASRVLCRLTFTPTPDGMRLDTSGKCASEGEAQQVTGWLACRKGSLHGPLLTLEGDRARELTTVRSAPSGLRIDVTTVSHDRRDAGQYRLDVDLAGDEITLSFHVIEMTDGGFHSASLTLKRER